MGPVQKVLLRQRWLITPTGLERRPLGWLQGTSMSAGPSRIVGSDPSAVWVAKTTLVLVTLIGLGVRLALIDQVLRNDEVATLFQFATDFGTAVSDYSYPNNHILHTILVLASTFVFGAVPWAIRLPALVFGVALIPLTFWWMSNAANREAGMLATAFVAGSSMMIEYSTIARGYMMLAVAFVVLMELSRRLLERQTRGLWLGWVAVSAAGFITVPVFAFPFAAVVTWLAINMLTRRAEGVGKPIGRLVVAIVAVEVVTILLYLPAALTTGIAALLANDFVRPLDWPGLFESWVLMAKKTAALVLRDDVFAFGYVGLVAIATIFNRRIFGRLVTPSLAMAGPLALMLILRVAPPQRVWLFGWPLALGLAGAGLGLIVGKLVTLPRPRRLVVAVTAIAMTGVMGVTAVSSGEILRSREAGTFRDAPATARLLAQSLGESDRIVIESHPRIVLAYYLRRLGDQGEHLRRGYESADRLYVVVYHPRPQDLAGVLEKARVPEQDFTSPVIRWRLPETDIYVMDRVESSGKSGSRPEEHGGHLTA